MAFPSTIGTFTNPNATDKLNSPSHSSIETAQNTALLEIERAIGTDASVIGTIIGDLRNSNSSGGGHVQAANKGGTGQTSFSKGDLLVASSSSVLSKLTVGSNGLVLTADSSQSAGMKWVAPGAVTTLIPRPLQLETATLVGHPSSITGYIMLQNVTNGITVNRLSIDVDTVTTAGSFRIGLYSEDGQTQITSVTAGSSVAGVKSIPMTSVVLSPGNYYSVYVPVSGNLVLQAWETGITPPTANLSRISGKQVYAGAVSVSGGVLPTTISPTTIGSMIAGMVIRLDN